MRKIEREVAEYLEYCKVVRGMSETTLKMKENVLSRFLSAVAVEAVEELKNADFNCWASLVTQRGVKPQTLNMYNAVVIAMVRYYQDIGVNVPLNLNLIRKVRFARASRMSYTEVEIGLAEARADAVTALMIRVMAETGMRVSELVRLRTLEIHGRRINFVGKGRKAREVYMSSNTAFRLAEFLNGREGYVWGHLALNGEPPTVNTVRNRMALAFLEAGMPGFYPHALRHSFATNLQRKGATVSEIKEMMGHSSVATTERYLHEFEGRMEELFDKYQG